MTVLSAPKCELDKFAVEYQKLLEQYPAITDSYIHHFLTRHVIVTPKPHHNAERLRPTSQQPTTISECLKLYRPPSLIVPDARSISDSPLSQASTNQACAFEPFFREHLPDGFAVVYDAGLTNQLRRRLQVGLVEDLDDVRATDAEAVRAQDEVVAQWDITCSEAYEVHSAEELFWEDEQTGACRVQILHAVNSFINNPAAVRAPWKRHHTLAWGKPRLGVGRGVADHSLRGSADYALFERKRLTVLTDGDMQQIPAVATPGSSVLINILGNRVRASQQVGRTRSTVPHFPHPEVLLQVWAELHANKTRWLVLHNSGSTLIFYLNHANILAVSDRIPPQGLGGFTLASALVALGLYDPSPSDPSQPDRAEAINTIDFYDLKKALDDLRELKRRGKGDGTSGGSVSAHAPPPPIPVRHPIDDPHPGITGPLSSDITPLTSSKAASVGFPVPVAVSLGAYEFSPYNDGKNPAAGVALSFDSDPSHQDCPVANVILGNRISEGRTWTVYEGLLSITMPARKRTSPRRHLALARQYQTQDIPDHDVPVADSSILSSQRLSTEYGPYQTTMPSDASTTLAPSSPTTSDTTVNLPVVLKVSDGTVRYAAEDDIWNSAEDHDRGLAVLNEFHVLNGPLKHIQDDIVPRCHGLWYGRRLSGAEAEVSSGPANLWLMIMGRVGAPVRAQGGWETLSDSARLAIDSLYDSVHGAGVVHGDVQLRHVCYCSQEAHQLLSIDYGKTSLSDLRLIDFDGAHIGTEEQINEESDLVKSLLGVA